MVANVPGVISGDSATVVKRIIVNEMVLEANELAAQPIPE